MIDASQIPARRTTNLVEAIQESNRGVEALLVLFPEYKDLLEKLPPVTVFKDRKEATDFLRSYLWLLYRRCKLDGKQFPVDLSVHQLMWFDISIGTRGRADARGIGMPPSMAGQYPEKLSFMDKLRGRRRD